jgi:exosortase
MNAKTFLALAGLAILGAFIWLRGTLAMDGGADTLPLLAVFPLYLWLGMPWKWSGQPPARPPWTAFAGLALTLAGIAGDSTLLLSAGWIAFLDAFQHAFLQKVPRRFLILPFLGFPWLTQNLESLGWLFRYTGAGAVGLLFTLLGLTVHREGTLLLIRNLPLSVEPACAGLNVLQSMLIVGCLLICSRVPAGWRFWLALASLVPLAWVANTSRIFMLGCAGLLFGSDFARGWFHAWGGWLVLCFMFLLCERVFTLWAGPRPRVS